MGYAIGGKSQQHERWVVGGDTQARSAPPIRKAQGALLVVGVSLLVVSLVFWRLAVAAGAHAGVALDGLAEVMAAVLGLSLTVVAIVVQLAGQRYSAKASESLSRAAAGDLTREELARARRSVAEAIERIADNCLAAVGHQDRNLALHTIRTIASSTRVLGATALAASLVEDGPGSFASVSLGSAFRRGR